MIVKSHLYFHDTFVFDCTCHPASCYKFNHEPFQDTLAVMSLLIYCQLLVIQPGQDETPLDPVFSACNRHPGLHLRLPWLSWQVYGPLSSATFSDFLHHPVTIVLFRYRRHLSWQHTACCTASTSDLRSVSPCSFSPYPADTGTIKSWTFLPLRSQ